MIVISQITNFQNCFLRWRSKCAGQKIRKKFYTSHMKWRLLQKLRSEVEMTEINPGSFWNLWHKVTLECKDQFLEKRSLIPGVPQSNTNSVAIKYKDSIQNQKLIQTSLFTVKFTNLQNVLSSSTACTITFKSRFLGIFPINFDQWYPVFILSALCSSCQCTSSVQAKYYISISKWAFIRDVGEVTFLASDDWVLTLSFPSAPVCTCCKAANLSLISMLHSQHSFQWSWHHSRLLSLAQIPLSP